MEVVKITQQGYCEYNGQPYFDDPNIVIPSGTYKCPAGNQINIPETIETLENGETVFITDQGLVICNNLTDGTGDKYTTTIDAEEYNFCNLFGYVQGNTFYYYEIEDIGA